MKYERPDCVDIIGEKAFLEVPIYKRKDKLKLVYVNYELFENMFDNFALANLEEYFSITINDKYKLNDEIIGRAYVDYQGDPSGIALDGNKGSGRAYYAGNRFNIKGELTPLATSPEPVYNNGKLSMESAIHETLISNVLSSDFSLSTYETLAILDPEESYLFPGSENEMNCALMVRVYKENELYRFSHRFVNGIPFEREELFKIAGQMGKLEGEKFIQRLLHGAWSLGNLSTNCNMIDFDTTYFTKNRNPSYSFTYRYQSNYFGEEYLGQIKILELILSSDLNIDKVELEELRAVVLKERYEGILLGFPKLMGIDVLVSDKLENLVNKFIELSKYGYKSYDELYTMDDKNDDVALFNFSNFFRYYPLLVFDNEVSISRCLKILINQGDIYDSDNNELKEKVNQYFSAYQVDSDDVFMGLLDEAAAFVKGYDEIFRNNVRDLNQAVINAYIVNEDRSYLFNNRLSKYHLADLNKESDGDEANRIMNLIIKGSRRNLGRDEYICDLKIAENNCRYMVIRNDAFHYEETDFRGNVLNQSESCSLEKFAVKVKRKEGYHGI